MLFKSIEDHFRVFSLEIHLCPGVLFIVVKWLPSEHTLEVLGQFSKILFFKWSFSKKKKVLITPNYRRHIFDSRLLHIVDWTPKQNDGSTFHLFSHVYAKVRYSSSSIWSSCCTYCIHIFLIMFMRLLSEMMERNFSHDSELLVPYYFFSLLLLYNRLHYCPFPYQSSICKLADCWDSLVNWWSHIS